ncbi:hypothetical protein LTR05_004495 [Lithohypha guttulata]|uniref:RNase III domain-containing protein n=1 Tax=Lithohypha guttulata TaxID=1690604 RepID=A0AAN7YGJ5_9EURO|nr:hypothetical protein LTR05_004495 [Lithohypha guttulata]
MGNKSKKAEPNMVSDATVEEITGYHFHDIDLMHEAITAAGMGSDGNKRLALVGDALIRLVTVDDWYPSGKSPADGQKSFTEIGTNEVLSLVGREQGVADIIVHNPCHGRSVPKTTLASSMEAIIGAVWVDSGKSLVDVRRVMQNLHILQD